MRLVKRARVIWAVTFVLTGVAWGSDGADVAAQTAGARGGAGSAKGAVLTEADLDKFERGLRAELDAVKAAQQRAASATNAQERGQAIQAQWDTATIPLGAKASGLAESRYREVRTSVDRVFTTLDFQGKIDGPLSIDLARADAATKARVSGDAFAELPPESAAALHARMDRLVPLWSEYKKLRAVAG